MKEQWRDVVGYSGYYQVSNLGRVRSVDRVIKHQYSGTLRLKGQELQQCLRGSYLAVGLCRGGITRTIRVHQLVATAWIKPNSSGQKVRHGVNGKLDNSVTNLSYGSLSDNQLDRRRDGTHRGKPVRRSDGVEFINMQVAAEESNCRANSICSVCKGKHKTTGGYGWEYIL